MTNSPTPKSNKKRLRTLLLTCVGDAVSSRLQNPSNQEIEKQLLSIPGGRQISCIELHRSKGLFITAAGSVAEGFLVKHREFSEAGDWECPNHQLDIKVTINIIASYADGDDKWRELVDWRRCQPKKIEEPSFIGGLVGIVFEAFRNSK